jgi:hypothetical protein
MEVLLQCPKKIQCKRKGFAVGAPQPIPTYYPATSAPCGGEWGEPVMAVEGVSASVFPNDCSEN